MKTDEALWSAIEALWSAIGPTRTCGDVRFRAAIRGIADIKRALFAAVIGGRYNTRFSSAFMVQAPVPASSVVSVERVDHCDYLLPDIDITLENALGRYSIL